MLIKQFVDEGLGNSSYLVASEETGRAVVIDPERDVDRYVQAAEGLGLKLTDAVDTHLHADFVSGLRELAAQYGVSIGASAEAKLAFDHRALNEGDTLSLGDLTLGVLATPGHTPEHISFTLAESGQASPSAIFTGGALIVGGAARTDLLGHHLAEPLARLSYHTIQDKLLRLPDHVSVYPTHGAGSFCNAPSSSDRVTTIGRERQWNSLARTRSEEEFVAQALNDLPSYPTYFGYLRAVNQLRTHVLRSLPILEPLSPQRVREEVAQGAVVLDTRVPREFAAGHIPNAYGVPLATPLGTWAGWVVPFGTPIILVVADPIAREEAVRQLIRIGYDDLSIPQTPRSVGPAPFAGELRGAGSGRVLRGYLAGGIEAWKGEGLPINRVPVMSAEELDRELEGADRPTVLDVRQDAEWRGGHLPRAIHVEGGHLPFDELPLARDERVVVHCGHADRSTVALSVLERRGYSNLALLYGGLSAWQAAGYPIAHDHE